MVVRILEKLLELETWNIQPFNFPEVFVDVTIFLTWIAPAGAVLLTDPTEVVVLPATVPLLTTVESVQPVVLLDCWAAGSSRI